MRPLVRLAIALLMVVFGFVSYCANTVENPITGEQQRVQLSQRQEVVLGQQAAPQMAQQHGGLYPDQTLQQYVDQVGSRIIQQSDVSESPYPFEFHLLRDSQTINAFALPGGQVFLTAGLLRQLTSEAQLAGVLGHEIGHVVARHAAEQLAKKQLGAALVTAVGVAVEDGQGSGRNAQVIAQAVNQVVNLNYGREDELESDRLGFRFMTDAGYNPQGIVELMEVLAQARGGQTPEFFSTHPNPNNRVQRLQELINQEYPNGVPAQLETGNEEFSRYVLPRLPGGR